MTVTVATTDFVGSSTLVAVIRTDVVEVTAGAVNVPPTEIVPCVADHVTCVCWVLLTVATKSCCLDEFMATEVGLIERLTGGATVTMAIADWVGSARLFAVTETVVSTFTWGAVNMPVLEIEPCVADHVTARLVALTTFAVNCWVSPEGMIAVVGVTYTWICRVGVALTIPVNRQNSARKNFTGPV